MDGEPSLDNLTIQTDWPDPDANTAFEDSSLDPPSFDHLNDDSNAVDTSWSSGFLQDAVRSGPRTSLASSVFEHDGLFQESTDETNQRILTASRQAYKPGPGTWAPEVTGNLFGGQYQNSVARFQIGQMQAAQDRHITHSNFNPLPEAEPDIENN
ncbi:uncharacterized protein N0V89_007945 [Didymosphaeria variabile]|uniref:Uncharacterized protein n=1 Tax=Didymosphaeria variabile TaxID=1932322 RepID=A0A9W8XEU7_9PLEO|nr:uncharacterized protein N0V89_007945 [Didymosphaeria variabile]KAJ4349331.1 hypothetical protein N0V89_007945 [Didymosphaeria variabile]